MSDQTGPGSRAPATGHGRGHPSEAAAPPVERWPAATTIVSARQQAAVVLLEVEQLVAEADRAGR
jgi:hypothetical protein